MQWLKTRRRPYTGILWAISAAVSFYGAVAMLLRDHKVLWFAVTAWAAMQASEAAENLSRRFDPPTVAGAERVVMKWAPLGADSLLLSVRDRRGELSAYRIGVPRDHMNVLRIVHTAATEAMLGLHDESTEGAHK